jgi:hypothetical protein
VGWLRCFAVFVCLVFGSPTAALALDPPFGGTVWVDKDIIKPDDWTAYQRLTYSGIAPRNVYDRRDNVYLTRPMHIFEATYADAPEVEVRVNSNDFSSAVAGQYAAGYAEMFGRLPTPLRTDMDTLTIHGGGALPFGGLDNGLLIHVDVEPTTVDFLEEILVHEATHAIYDDNHRLAPAWMAAQAADPTFISTYARDYPDREDVAETLLMWFAVRQRSDRLDAATVAATESAIPNRLAYFDALPFSYSESTPGDINFDGHVNAADYVMWRKNQYQTLTQYIQWRSRFGKFSSAGSGASVTRSSTAVCEPASGLAIVVVAIYAISCRRSRASIPSRHLNQTQRGQSRRCGFWNYEKV